MSLHPNRRLLALVAAATLLGAATLGAATPASAAPAHATASFTLDYVAFGDSYAAGQGGGGPQSPPCNQTRLSYPSLLNLAPAVRLTANATCAGATTSDVLNLQLPQAATALASAELVTLTVGGNDVNPALIAAACGADPTSPACATAVAAATAAVPGVTTNVANTVGAIAQSAPGARIVVTGYPLLLEPLPTTDPRSEVVTKVNSGTVALNLAIAAAVKVTGDAGANVRFADVTSLFAGHGLGSRFPWIRATGPDAYHPNAFGYAAYAVAVGKAALAR
jgi:lysophospholipase L1-like esterase